MNRKIYVVLSLLLLGVPFRSFAQVDTKLPGEAGKPLWTVKGDLPSGKEGELIKACLVGGQTKIEKFFGQPFAKPFEVEVFPNRNRFDEYVAKRWKWPKTEPWMVACGASDKLTIISREVWKTEASEHDPKDDQHLRKLIAHEMVHVYHGQQNPSLDFDGMDDLGWFVEGLAVYVSDQLDRSHKTAAAEAIKLGKAPTKLADAWSGRYRYGVSGSLVRFVDQKIGRAKLKKLMAVTKPDDALRIIQMTEPDLLANWQRAVKQEAQAK
jgi:hypothetical protein